jgi:serine/threonine-protein kinase RsbW
MLLPRGTCHAPDFRAPATVCFATRSLAEVRSAGARVRDAMSIMGNDRPHTNSGGARNGSGVRNGHVRTHHVADLEPVAPRASDVRLTLPARPENVAVARHVLGGFAEALNLPAEVIEDIKLAVTEACTNVVRHAYDADEPGMLEIVIRPDGDLLDVIVSDRGRGIGPSPDTAGPGLGLPLIAALVHKLEIQHAPRAGSRLAMSFLQRPSSRVAA